MEALPGAGVSPVSLSLKPSLEGGLGGLAQISFIQKTYFDLYSFMD